MTGSIVICLQMLFHLPLVGFTKRAWGRCPKQPVEITKDTGPSLVFHPSTLSNLFHVDSVRDWGPPEEVSEQDQAGAVGRKKWENSVGSSSVTPSLCHGECENCPRTTWFFLFDLNVIFLIAVLVQIPGLFFLILLCRFLPVFSQSWMSSLSVTAKNQVILEKNRCCVIKKRTRETSSPAYFLTSRHLTSRCMKCVLASHNPLQFVTTNCDVGTLMYSVRWWYFILNVVALCIY